MIKERIYQSLEFLDEHINSFIDECTANVKSSNLPWWKKRFLIFRLNRLRKKYGRYKFSISFFGEIYSCLSEIERF